MSSAPLTTETLVAETSDCTLAVTVTAGPAPEVLHLHYRVHNMSAQPLYFLNNLWENAWRDTTRNQVVFDVLPNLANVEASADAITVSKKVVDVPYGLLVETRLIPLITRIEPGTEYAEIIELLLPLRLNNMYQAGPLNVAAVPLPLHFELGYLRPELATKTALREVATPSGKALGTDAFPASEQALISVGPFRQPFPVLADERPLPQPSNSQWTPWG